MVQLCLLSLCFLYSLCSPFRYLTFISFDYSKGSVLFLLFQLRVLIAICFKPMFLSEWRGDEHTKSILQCHLLCNTEQFRSNSLWMKICLHFNFSRFLPWTYVSTTFKILLFVWFWTSIILFEIENHRHERFVRLKTGLR